MIQVLQRRPVAGLLLLVFFNLLLLSVQIRSPQGRLLLREFGLFIVSPVAFAIDFSIDMARQGTEDVRLFFDIRSENRRLQDENRLLKIELAKLRGLTRMTERTRGFERLRSQYEFDTIVAGIIWRSMAMHSRKLLANVGTIHGVRKDSAVLSSEGVVGRISVTTPFTSEIELLNSAGAAAGAIVGDRVQGVLEGDGGELLSLRFIPNAEQVLPGDIVYTAGTDQIYPKDLPLGRVVGSRPSQVYREIQVQPMADLTRIEEVLIALSP